MNSSLFISHRLFVAAVNDQDGERPKAVLRNASKPQTETARVLRLEYVGCAEPAAELQKLPEPDCLMGL